MIMKRLIALALITTVGLMGCGTKKDTDKNKETAVGESSEQVKLSEEYATADDAVNDSVSKIKYDLQTIIDTSRGEETVRQYPLAIYVEQPEIEDVQSNNKDKSEEGDTEHGHEEEVTEVEKPEALVQYLSETGISEDSLEDYAIAFNKDTGYMVSVIKPKLQSKDSVEDAIKGYLVNQAENGKDEEIKQLYKDYKFYEHNGHFIIVVASDAESIKSSILSQMIYVDTLIGESVRLGYNKETGQTEVNELTEEQINELISSNPESEEVSETKITGHTHEDGTYHDGEAENEAESKVVGHYHADGTYHEGSH